MPGEDFVLVFEGLPGEEVEFAVPRGQEKTTPLIPPKRPTIGPKPAPASAPAPTNGKTTAPAQNGPAKPSPIIQLVPPPAPSAPPAPDAPSAALTVPEIDPPQAPAPGTEPGRLSGAAFFGILVGGAAVLGIGAVIVNALMQSMDGTDDVGDEPESEPEPEEKRAPRGERELSLLYMDGCEACEAFKPTFESAISALEAEGVKVKKIEASGVLPEGTPDVAAVPALVLREGDKTKILDGRKVMKRDWNPEDVVKFATSAIRAPRKKAL